MPKNWVSYLAPLTRPLNPSQKITLYIHPKKFQKLHNSHFFPFKATVSWDRFQKFWQKFTELGFKELSHEIDLAFEDMHGQFLA